MPPSPTPRRARQPDSLAASVISILGELQTPVATPAMRVILTDRGRLTSAEQLGRLAAYQREDFARSHVPPPLCWTVEPDGTATSPRWWALSEWRFGRRIRTTDTGRVWRAHLAVWLTSDLARRPEGRSDEFVSLALGSIACVLGPQSFDVPSSPEEWWVLRTSVYEPFTGSFSNLTGVTGEQQDVEESLSGSLSGFDRLFGRPDAK